MNEEISFKMGVKFAVGLYMGRVRDKSTKTELRTNTLRLST